jgi:hypothetical protein
MARRAKPTHVYFIQAGDDGPIKVGSSTKDVQRRLDELQVGNPYKLRILHSFWTIRALEKQIHSVLGEHRLQGEWFEAHPFVLALGEALASKFPQSRPFHFQSFAVAEKEGFEPSFPAKSIPGRVGTHNAADVPGDDA